MSLMLLLTQRYANTIDYIFQGIECMVFIHEPRSLSEMKELNATKLESSWHISDNQNHLLFALNEITINYRIIVHKKHFLYRYLTNRNRELLYIYKSFDGVSFKNIY